MHETSHRRTASAMPANTRRMTAQEIVTHCQKHWSMKDEPATFAPCKPGNKATAFMVEVMSTYEDPAHWKNAFYAKYPKDANGAALDEWVKAAIIWYHGAKPIETYTGVRSTGYAC